VRERGESLRDELVTARVKGPTEAGFVAPAGVREPAGEGTR
jgi:hypothetical protein